MSPTTLPLQRYLTALHQTYRALDDGAVATYIPELAKADPDWFGICVVTTDGYAYAVGESDRHFTVQSVSKPAVYAAALADRGREGVLRRVGVEPSGEAFNSISLDPQTGAPLNPMINAGAIATTGLIAGATAVEQWERIADVMSTFCGRSLSVDSAVYRSESESGFRNRAIAWMLKNFGIIEGDPMPVLENYFRQCSILVTCRDLAFMAATLANGGVHPRTGKRAVPADEIQAVLSIMATCGMYDYAGSWLYEVGLPAKSGVSGGVIAVMPGRFGIAIFSPRLDENGNSARGIAVCREISREFGLHVFGVSVSPSLVLSRVFSALDLPSRRVRSTVMSIRLRETASRIRCYCLQGEVAFDGAEFVVRNLVQAALEVDSFILDMHRVSYLAESAARLLHDVRQLLVAQGKALVFSRIRGRAVVEAALRHALPEGDNGYLSFEDNDLAVEWCEDRLLESAAELSPRVSTVAAFPLFAGMPERTLARLQERMQSADYPAGATIISAGQEQDDRVFFIREGEVSVVLSLADGSHQRLATLSSGMSFGEMAMLGKEARSASVHADTAVRSWTLSAKVLDELAVDYPEIKIAVLGNLSRDLAQKLRQANQLIGVLAA
ncbi:MAG TPA: glutaminase A [Casimicrobiaceae bacterium]|nr:glutaminase A [Casimicrobiaceae bacterium]